jgi:hypothetical protein
MNMCPEFNYLRERSIVGENDADESFSSVAWAVV